MDETPPQDKSLSSGRISHCVFPWHWLMVDISGNVHACGHGSNPIGNLNEQSAEELWNGAVIQELRQSILDNRIHPVCRNVNCPYQGGDPRLPSDQKSYSEAAENLVFMDEADYCKRYEGVQQAVADRYIASATEHYLRHGAFEQKTIRIQHPYRHALLSLVRRVAPALHHRLVRRTLERRGVLGLNDYNNRRIRTSSTPTDIGINCTTICNLKCVMCPQSQGSIPVQHSMEVTLLRKMDPYLRKAQRVLITSIGESMLSEAFLHLLKFPHYKFSPYFRFNTNGHYLTGEHIGTVLASKLTEVSISVDSTDEQTYRKIRGADLENVLVNIRSIIAQRRTAKPGPLKIFINMTLMRENIDGILPMLDLAHELKVDGLILYQLASFGDNPSWVVDKPNFRFVYQDQMIRNFREHAKHRIEEAVEYAKLHSINLQLRDNIHEYITPQN